MFFFFMSNLLMSSLQYLVLYLLMSSLKYLSWLKKVPSLNWWIWSLRKYWSYPIIDISSSFCDIKKISFHKDSLVAPNMISSTKIWTSKMSCLIFLIKEVLSTCPLWNVFSRNNLLRRSYHTLWAIFIVYEAFLSLKTWSGKLELINLGG